MDLIKRLNVLKPSSIRAYYLSNKFILKGLSTSIEYRLDNGIHRSGNLFRSTLHHLCSTLHH
uniref:Uncharacterized protein n=3 Tax=unclassified bacterial viruses TaxID=12333 RepID=A0AAU8KVA2_9VIRU